MYDLARFSRAFSHDRVAEEPAGYGASKAQPSSSASPSPDVSSLAGHALEGQALRLAMALVQGADVAASDRAAKVARLRESSRRAAGAPPAPVDDAGLVGRLHQLARAGDRTLAELVRLLPALEASGLWRTAGCRDCVAWLDRELDISRVYAFEYLRAARALTGLPIIESLFATGKLSWSKVRELTRVADATCEAELAVASLDLSVSETIELCRRWRHRDRDGAGGDGEGGEPGAEAALAAATALAFEERSLTWNQPSEARMRIVLDLPFAMGVEYLKANECAEDELREEDARARNGLRAPAPDTSASIPPQRTARQYRADAAMLNAIKALAHRGEAICRADRYRVLLNVDARVLVDEDDAASLAPGELPPERPTVAGYGPISIAEARTIAAKASLTVVATMPNGEVVGVGGSTRRWPTKVERAVRARDRHCQMPGCTRTRWTDLHHVVPVAEGGKTEAALAALTCSCCHKPLHDCDLRLERTSVEDIDLGPEADRLGLSEVQELRAKGFVSKLQRFRAIGPNGRVVAGPRRKATSGSAEHEGRPGRRNGEVLR